MTALISHLFGSIKPGKPCRAFPRMVTVSGKRLPSPAITHPEPFHILNYRVIKSYDVRMIQLGITFAIKPKFAPQHRYGRRYPPALLIRSSSLCSRKGPRSVDRRVSCSERISRRGGFMVAGNPGGCAGKSHCLNCFLSSLIKTLDDNPHQQQHGLPLRGHTIRSSLPQICCYRP